MHMSWNEGHRLSKWFSSLLTFSLPARPAVFQKEVHDGPNSEKIPKEEFRKCLVLFFVRRVSLFNIHRITETSSRRHVLCWNLSRSLLYAIKMKLRFGFRSDIAGTIFWARRARPFWICRRVGWVIIGRTEPLRNPLFTALCEKGRPGLWCPGLLLRYSKFGNIVCFTADP
jgi:hypothetical protein